MNYTCRRCHGSGHNRRTCPTTAQVSATQGRVDATPIATPPVEYDEEGEVIEAELPLPDMSTMISGIVLVVPGYAFHRDKWDSTAAWLESEGWSVVWARSAAEAKRMAVGLQPDAIFVDAHPTLGCGHDDTARLIAALAEAAPASGVACIASTWAQNKQLEDAVCKAGAVFYGYPTVEKPAMSIAWHCVNVGSKNWSRALAAKHGIELQ